MRSRPSIIPVLNTIPSWLRCIISSRLPAACLLAGRSPPPQARHGQADPAHPLAARSDRPHRRVGPASATGGVNSLKFSAQAEFSTSILFCFLVRRLSRSSASLLRLRTQGRICTSIIKGSLQPEYPYKNHGKLAHRQ
jgi:hypothetical protein